MGGQGQRAGFRRVFRGLSARRGKWSLSSGEPDRGRGLVGPIGGNGPDLAPMQPEGARLVLWCRQRRNASSPRCARTSTTKRGRLAITCTRPWGGGPSRRPCGRRESPSGRSVTPFGLLRHAPFGGQRRHQHPPSAPRRRRDHHDLRTCSIKGPSASEARSTASATRTRRLGSCRSPQRAGRSLGPEDEG